MKPWTQKLIPSINCDLKTLRDRAAQLNFKVQTKIVSFIDLTRQECRSWKLISKNGQVEISPLGLYSPETMNRHEQVFQLINEVTKESDK